MYCKLIEILNGKWLIPGLEENGALRRKGEPPFTEINIVKCMLLSLKNANIKQKSAFCLASIKKTLLFLKQ